MFSSPELSSVIGLTVKPFAPPSLIAQAMIGVQTNSASLFLSAGANSASCHPGGAGMIVIVLLLSLTGCVMLYSKREITAYAKRFKKPAKCRFATKGASAIWVSELAPARLCGVRQ